MNRLSTPIFASLILAATLAITGPALAEMAGEAAAPAAALIPASSFPAAGLLPPPPADGTPWAKAEMDELHAIEASRTDAEFAAAKWDNDHENASAFDGVMGVSLASLPETAKLLKAVLVEEKAAGKPAKNHFARNRPWIVDPALKTCARNDPPKSSYPSGHTTMGYSMAVVLAHLAPEKAGAIMARANEYGYHRLVCSMHYRADIVAGQTLGTLVGYALLQNPQFMAQFEEAHAELVKAGVAH